MHVEHELLNVEHTVQLTDALYKAADNPCMFTCTGMSPPFMVCSATRRLRSIWDSMRAIPAMLLIVCVP